MIDFFGIISIDTLYVVCGLAGAWLVSFVIAIIALCKAARLNKKYKAFMQGENGKSIEGLVLEKLESIQNLQTTTDRNSEAIRDIYEKMSYTFQKIGMVKYDAFNGMGGKLSFALCLLDKHNSGCIVNVMHSNDGCFAYVKSIEKGYPELELGEEERKALEEAMAGKMGDPNLSQKINDEIAKDVEV